MSNDDHELEPDLREEISRSSDGTLTEDDIQQMIMLASRLREQAGGELDDDALIAVSEATGAPLDYIRLAMRSVPQQTRKRRFSDQLRQSFLSFDPDMRRMVMAGVLALGAGFGQFWSQALPIGDPGGLFSIVGTIMWVGGIYNAAVSRNTKTALVSGAILGLGSQVTAAVLAFLDAAFTPVGHGGSSPFLAVFLTILAAGVGSVAHEVLKKNRKVLGLGDPVEERHQLLTQLLDIQSKLKQDEKHVTFISVDVVGSTRIKTENEHTEVEYTLNEYHKYIEQIALKFRGKVHSTAGDGVTCVFDDAKEAISAGKAMQAGLFEFNAFKNKLKSPVEMRAAVHTGNVLAPGKESTAVNFAHVIDVAAHLQKIAEPGTLAVSQEAALYVGGLDSIGPERIQAEDTQAAVWRPKLTLRSQDLSAIVPPLPTRRN
ncbi:MAG: adenylate/guanylate cyclase domain-containing protein [Fimbriimonadaceae bacterium]